MVQIIAGEKGKGKTKYLLDKANAAIKESTGSIVYLDKSSKHMYELNNKIRLINVKEYPITSSEAFVGFICGIISQDYDLEMMFLDSFLKLAALEGEDISETITTLENIGEKYHVTFVLSVSMDKENMPENAQKDVIIAL
ncbi:twitching motility protein PilT [Lachnoclostridium sp. An14]|uniref:twitching motility protein PilT n=1 Tax=Lachnoclostridium sp. An14 TaxID=1965562 RepID=UPI000B374B85|nr:twitching motility protein PilT [Lachnoclostridium sp. An14]OUQ21778.1 twitching motility protein PilT [Lachnoclostridium sp. An14]